MARTSRFVTHVLDLLAPLGPVEARAMFGGWGLRCGGRMFALVMDDRLYLKTDAESIPAFEAAGCTPFTYARQGREPVAMSYWSAPEDALESPEGLQPWAERGLDAARRAEAATRRSPRSRRPPRRKA
jgi:DNA transformation protein and related proteins